MLYYRWVPASVIKLLKQKGCKNIKLVCIIASSWRGWNVPKESSWCEYFAAALDERLNRHLASVPGLGDAGGRLFRNKVIYKLKSWSFLQLNR